MIQSDTGWVFRLHRRPFRWVVDSGYKIEWHLTLREAHLTLRKYIVIRVFLENSKLAQKISRILWCQKAQPLSDSVRLHKMAKQKALPDYKP